MIPVGACQAVAVDFRLLAATQEPLDELVRSGAFRGDLYARLSGAQVQLPPLRQRREEVLRLLRAALRPALGRAPVFDSLFAESVCKYAWPYNVRELMQLARLLAVCIGAAIVGWAAYALAVPVRLANLPAIALSKSELAVALASSLIVDLYGFTALFLALATLIAIARVWSSPRVEYWLFVSLLGGGAVIPAVPWEPVQALC